MKNKRTVLVVLVFALGILFIAGLWTIDVSMSAMLSSAMNPNLDVTYFTVLGVQNPAYMYHIGLAMCLSAFVGTGAIALCSIMERIDK